MTVDCMSIASRMQFMGRLVNPLPKSTGGIIWPVLDDGSGTHILVAYAPKSRRLACNLLSRTLDGAPAKVVTVDARTKPADARRTVRTLLSRKEDSEPVILAIHGLEMLYRGIRREDTRKALSNDIRRLFKVGPSLGVHVVLQQQMDDDNASMLARLGLSFNTIIAVGRMSPIASEMVIGDKWGCSIPDGRRNAYVMEKTGKSRKYATVDMSYSI